MPFPEGRFASRSRKAKIRVVEKECLEDLQGNVLEIKLLHVDGDRGAFSCAASNTGARFLLVLRMEPSQFTGVQLGIKRSDFQGDVDARNRSSIVCIQQRFSSQEAAAGTNVCMISRYWSGIGQLLRH